MYDIIATPAEAPGQQWILQVPIRLSRTSPTAVSVNYTTRDGTAKSGDDYLPVSGTLTWAPGQLDRHITVITLLGAATGTFFVDLTMAQDGRLAKPIGTIALRTGGGVDPGVDMYNDVLGMLNRHWVYIQRATGEAAEEADMPPLVTIEGIVKNNQHPGGALGGYTPEGTASSEGISLMMRGIARAYQAVGGNDRLNYAKFLMDANIEYFHFGDSPSANSSQKWYHTWLINAGPEFAVRGPLASNGRLEQGGYINRPSSFIGGRAVLNPAPQVVYQVVTSGTEFVWQNVFSDIVPGTGSNVTVEYYITAEGNKVFGTQKGGSFGQPIIPSGDPGNENPVPGEIVLTQSLSGSYGVNYCVTVPSTTIAYGEVYEAWPMWRKLGEGERAIAGDAIHWYKDAYKILKTADPNYQVWNNALNRTLDLWQEACNMESAEPYIFKAGADGEYNNFPLTYSYGYGRTNVDNPSTNWTANPPTNKYAVARASDGYVTFNMPNESAAIGTGGSVRYGMAFENSPLYFTYTPSTSIALQSKASKPIALRMAITGTAANTTYEGLFLAQPTAGVQTLRMSQFYQYQTSPGDPSGGGGDPDPDPDPPDDDYHYDRFIWSYNTLHDPANTYFGPPSGPKARQIPYHARERAIIIEAPDWTREAVSETMSFWMKLEAWNSILTGSITGYQTAWNSLENHFIPNSANQPWGDYEYTSPATYTPDAPTIEDTPMDQSDVFAAGPDPLFTQLFAAYNTKEVYLMHWMIDVDGDYGYKNGDGSLVGVFINNYRRGPVEDGLGTITHPAWDDFNNGGASDYGFQAIYNRSKEKYPDSINPFPYSKQWSYTCAPDAEARAIGGAYLVSTKVSGVNVTAYDAKAKKMADYMRYVFFDKYFRPIPGYDGSGCHYLNSWGAGFGGGVPEPNQDSYWGFRIGASEIHMGYNCVDIAYYCKTGGPFRPLSSGAGAMYDISFDRQLELIRWLQSPEGPIAGGVTSSWRGRYETPSDGRQNAKFYGLYYNYSPSWFNPPSNNWTGFQAWGMQRVASLYVEVAGKPGSEAQSVVYRIGVILDRFVQWFVNNCEVDLVNDTCEYPVNSRWTTDAPIAGVTSNQPTPLHGEYEYLPTLNWDSNGNYETFWNAATVPNPNLHYATTEMSWDPGTGAGFAQILIDYCQAKKQIHGNLNGIIPGGTSTYNQVLQKAVDLMEFLWNHRDSTGFGSSQPMDYPGLDYDIWVPPEFGTGYMPNGEVIANGQSKFHSLRATMYHSTAEWPALRRWLDGIDDEPPTIIYHRFWNGCDVAVAFAMLAKYFPESRPTGS